MSRGLGESGFEVDASADPVRGLEMALSKQYDLVVLDLLMPGLDGRELLARLLAAKPSQPVLVLSALSDIGSKVESLRLGAEDYLAKPFAFEELLARVQARVRASRSRPVLKVGRLHLNLVTHEADSGGGPVTLATREFLLLQELMLQAGHVVTKESLLAKVWGVRFDPGTNVVDVYISRLRSKLGVASISTARGRGYVISVD